MNPAYIFLPLLILSLSDLFSAIILFSREVDHTHNNGVQDTYHSVRHEDRFKKLEVIEVNPKTIEEIQKEVDERRENNRTKLLPENLSSPLVIYRGKIERNE